MKSLVSSGFLVSGTILLTKDKLHNFGLQESCKILLKENFQFSWFFAFRMRHGLWGGFFKMFSFFNNFIPHLLDLTLFKTKENNISAEQIIYYFLPKKAQWITQFLKIRKWIFRSPFYTKTTANRIQFFCCCFKLLVKFCSLQLNKKKNKNKKKGTWTLSELQT